MVKLVALLQKKLTARYHKYFVTIYNSYSAYSIYEKARIRGPVFPDYPSSSTTNFPSTIFGPFSLIKHRT